MPIVTFRSNSDVETGNTSAAIAVSTYMSIKHNMKVLLISTSLNDDTMKESFWIESNQKKALLRVGQARGTANIQSGIEGLSRMITSGKIEPRIIRDYTRVVLTGRFDVLLGMDADDEESKKNYEEIQKKYIPVIKFANQFYDMVIVDLDRRLSQEIQDEIIGMSNIKVITTSQKLKELQKSNKYIEEGMNKSDSLIAIGRYDEELKCNLKNVTRNIFKTIKSVNAIPYNSKFYEAMQEGMVIDLFLNLLRIQNKKDSNYIFLQETQKLSEDINKKWEELRMIKKFE